MAMLLSLASISWAASAPAAAPWGIMARPMARSPVHAIEMRLPFLPGGEPKPKKKATSEKPSGLVVPVARFGFGWAARTSKSEPAKQEEVKKELSIKELLSEYGLIARERTPSVNRSAS